MKLLVSLLTLFIIMLTSKTSAAEPISVWQLVTERGTYLTDICYEPSEGDTYISADNGLYEVLRVQGSRAIMASKGEVKLPASEWLEAEKALPVAFINKSIALYCTHSDESFEPSDGYYTTIQRGSIYEIAHALANALSDEGVKATVADTLHHPHDAGAYRRSRQTAVELLKTSAPDCLIDIHRDGIPDPASYAAVIGGEEASKIRLLVGRGNQNAAVNKEFALTIKSIADRVYPGLIKDIYMGKGTFNQDLLPHSILLECGTYTLEKTRVIASMSMMADVLSRSLYGELIGSVGYTTTDVKDRANSSGGIVMGETDQEIPAKDKGVGSGLGFLAVLLLVGILGFPILSAGSIRGGMRKAGRNLSEMTGGLIGKEPQPNEDPEHS